MMYLREIRYSSAFSKKGRVVIIKSLSKIARLPSLLRIDHL